MNALLLVDLQNDFLPGGALAVTNGDAVISVANRLQNNFELVLATQDWHPADHLSFAANHPGQKIGDQIQLGGRPQILWPMHCVQESQGAAFSSALDQRRIAKVFQKGTDREIDSYSGFFDNGHLKSTGLGDYLRHQNVTTLYVLGLATDYCVKATALDARTLGLTTVLVTDGCRGVNLKSGDVASALAEMQSAGVSLLESNEVLRLLRFPPVRKA